MRQLRPRALPSPIRGRRPDSVLVRCHSFRWAKCHGITAGQFDLREIERDHRPFPSRGAKDIQVFPGDPTTDAKNDSRDETVTSVLHYLRGGMGRGVACSTALPRGESQIAVEGVFISRARLPI
jgi:hypothetical protein